MLITNKKSGRLCLVICNQLKMLKFFFSFLLSPFLPSELTLGQQTAGQQLQVAEMLQEPGPRSQLSWTEGLGLQSAAPVSRLLTVQTQRSPALLAPETPPVAPRLSLEWVGGVTVPAPPPRVPQCTLGHCPPLQLLTSPSPQGFTREQKPPPNQMHAFSG